MEERTELNSLACQLMEAKRRESEAKDRRIAIEEEIAGLVETSPIGSKTVDAGGGLKVVVKRSMSYQVDIEGLRELDVDPEALPLTRTDPKPPEWIFDKKAYEKIVQSDDHLAAELAKCITSKPLKTSVTVKA